MKWKYIGNRAGDATKGEQYIVEADELTELYMKEMPYPQLFPLKSNRVASKSE